MKLLGFSSIAAPRTGGKKTRVRQLRWDTKPHEGTAGGRAGPDADEAPGEAAVDVVVLRGVHHPCVRVPQPPDVPGGGWGGVGVGLVCPQLRTPLPFFEGEGGGGSSCQPPPLRISASLSGEGREGGGVGAPSAWPRLSAYPLPGRQTQVVKTRGVEEHPHLFTHTFLLPHRYRFRGTHRPPHDEGGRLSHAQNLLGLIGVLEFWVEKLYAEG